MPRMTKDGQYIISVAVDPVMIEWLDSKRTTPYGKLQRSAVMRTILERAMNVDKTKRPE